MTLHTKEAMNEIYDIFSQPLKNPGDDVAEAQSEEEVSSDDDDEDDYTSGAESTGTGRISAAASDFGDETSAGDFTLGTTVGADFTLGTTIGDNDNDDDQTEADDT